MTRPLLLDLFCCEGGASTGYAAAGFDIVGVDIDPQPDYPFSFIQADAVEFLAHLIAVRAFLGNITVDAVSASPPCQRYSTSTQSTGTPDDHPDLVPIVRDLLDELGRPYIIENVEGAPVRRDVVLCGSMFDLPVRRHRVFELSGWIFMGAPQCDHAGQRARFGRTVDVTGHAGGRNQTLRSGYPRKWYDLADAREAMGMPWASGRGCTEAIPPAYTELLGSQLIDHV